MRPCRTVMAPSICSAKSGCSFPWIVAIIADSAYAGRFEAALTGLRMAVQIVRRPDFAKGFVLLPKRWRVEQAFGAGRFCRRLLVDHETLPQVSEAMIRLVSTLRIVLALATLMHVPH